MLIATSVSLTTAPLSAWKTGTLSILGKYTSVDATELQVLSANWFRDSICNSLHFELLSVMLIFPESLIPANLLTFSLRPRQDMSLW